MAAKRSGTTKSAVAGKKRLSKHQTAVPQSSAHRQSKYGITRRVLGCPQFIAISKKTFEDAFHAKDYFFDALGIEEKFDLLAENYAEFERDLVQLTMHQMLFQDISWSLFRGHFSTINRRVANLLSACRLYVDHVRNDISAIYGKESSMFERLQGACSREFDTRLGYCILDQVRNHMQHSGLPLYHLSYPSTRDFPGNADGHLKYGCVASISLARLKQEKAFKAVVLSRLPNETDLVDVRPLVRDYVSGLGSVHTQLRQWMAADIKGWRQTLVKIRDRFKAKYGKDHAGLAVVERGPKGQFLRYADIFDDFIDEHARLLRKHRTPEHNVRKFITTEVWPRS